MKLKINTRIILFSIYFFIVALAVFCAFKAADFSKFNEENSLLIPVEDFTPNFLAHDISQEEVGLQVYELTIPKEKLSHLEGDEFNIIFNRMLDNAYKFYVNDVCIFVEGDMEKGRSVMRYS